VVQAGTHLMMSVMENGQDATADQQAAEKTIRDEGIKALAGQAFEKVVGPILGVAVGAVNEDVGEAWQKFLEDEPPTPQYGDFKVFANLLDTLTAAPEGLEGPRDETNSDGTNSLDTSVDNAPSVDYTGKATNGSGTGLQNVGVALTDGNDTDAPIAAGATTTNGTFNLAIPAGASVPSSALFQITALDESGDIATFDGTTVNLAKGSQSIGSTSISYDNDDDDDDDSDGSQRANPGQSVHGVGVNRAVRPRATVTRPAAAHRPVPRPGRSAQRRGAPRKTVRTLAQ
jgi:hypothetical protein